VKPWSKILKDAYIKKLGGIFLEEDKWYKEKLRKAMKESKEEAIELHFELFNSMVDLCVRALKTHQTAKSEPLDPLQINQIAIHEIEIVIKTLSNTRFADMIIRKAGRDFLEQQGNF
jgi:hypothetical protein